MILNKKYLKKIESFCRHFLDTRSSDVAETLILVEKTFIFDSAKQHFIQTRNRNALAFHLFTFMNYFRTKRDLLKKTRMETCGIKKCKQTF